MNPERLLAHYEKIADAPDAIARLRRFVLDLAVRGKLLNADQTNWRQLPITACLEPLADGRLIHQGWSPRCEDHPSPSEQAWGVLKTTAIQDGQFLPEQNKKLPAKLTPKPHLEVQRGDILITCAGPRARCGIACLVTETRRRLMISGKMYRFRANAETVLPQYLLLFLRSDHAQASIDAMKTGSSESGLNLTQDRFSKLQVRCGTLTEQRRIVAKVDELMGLCDRLEAARAKREATRDRLTAASLARLNAPDPETFQEDARFVLDALPALTARPDQIKALRQTILNLAVRGKLVPQDPNDEPASELLKRIAKERAHRVSHGTLREQKLLPPIEGADVEFELAQGWQWVRMAQVIKLWNGFAFKSGDFQSAGVPVVRIGDLQDGVVTLSQAAHVSEAVAKTVGPEVWIPHDALLIAMSGATTGKTAFNKTGIPLLLNQRVGRIEVFLIDVNFLRIFFETIVARNLSISFGTAIPNLSAQQINETVFPLPPLAEQHRIVAKVDALMALCDRLEASLATAGDTRRRLLDALLAEALAPADVRDTFVDASPDAKPVSTFAGDASEAAE